MIRCAVLGSPIAHSLSPTLHQCAYRELGIDGEYSAIEVSAGQLKQFITSRDESWTGFSLTMPLKEEVIALASTVDTLAKRIHSANTLSKTAEGWHAISTDVPGFLDALSFNGYSHFDSIVVLGSGATARAAVAALDAPGKSITVIHRSSHREPEMRVAALHADMQFLPWGSQLPKSDLFINTTPAGVADEYASLVDQMTSGIFFEALYNPWPTYLLETWRKRGRESVDGLDLLVHQAMYQLETMTGSSVDHAALWPILRKAGLSTIKK